MRPSHASGSGRSGPTVASSASRRTESPAESTTSTEISLRSRSSTAKRLTSLLPSPLGENTFHRLTTCATAGSPLIRWAAKNAANVAPTSSTKTTRASRVTYGDLSAQSRATTLAGRAAALVRAVGQRLRLLVDLLGARDVEQA